MNRNWISPLADYLRQGIRGMRSSLAALRSNDFYVDSDDTDVDGRRLRSELDAIRSRYQDHS